MHRSPRHPLGPAGLVCAAIVLGALVATGAALGAGTSPPSRQPVTAPGTLVQLPDRGGCLVDRSRSRRGCTAVRALAGPGPFLGSRAVAIDPKGKNVYVASSRSNAIAIFRRDARTGRLTQASGTRGCIAAGAAGGCARALGLVGPNSVAVSADGRNVYATSLKSDAVAVFTRNPTTGALTQTRDGRGCLSGATTSGCTTGRALDGPDVVTVSPDGRNVYVGSFVANAIAVLARNTSTGALTQPAGAGGCIGGAPADGCATGLALSAPEGLAISKDANTVYVAAAVSNAVGVLARDASTGALTQATDGTGCIVQGALAGCTTGTQLAGANAVTVSPDDGSVYVTSLVSNSVTSFTRAATTGALAQKAGTAACAVFLLANGCSLGRAMNAPEGLTVSPDGGEVYVAAFASGAIDTLTRNAQSGALMQKPRRPGCVVIGAASDCTPGRALSGASSVAVSPDGRNVYSTAFSSDAVAVFKRVTRGS
jgi:DNA-binding beta-propeller fold protein YncE